MGTYSLFCTTERLQPLVAMHAINEVYFMLWRMHAYFRVLQSSSTNGLGYYGIQDVTEVAARHGCLLTKGAIISSPIRLQYVDPQKGSGYNRFYLVAQCYW